MPIDNVICIDAAQSSRRLRFEDNRAQKMRRRLIALGTCLRVVVVPERLPLVVLIPDVSALIERNEVAAAVLKNCWTEIVCDRMFPPRLCDRILGP